MERERVAEKKRRIDLTSTGEGSKKKEVGKICWSGKEGGHSSSSLYVRTTGAEIVMGAYSPAMKNESATQQGRRK